MAEMTMCLTIEDALGKFIEDGGLQTAVAAVLRERIRQVSDEGWTKEHDDEHTDGSLALVAACYAMPTSHREIKLPATTPTLWPESWDSLWWKPKTRRRDLVRAAALLLAEIARIDRASPPEVETQQPAQRRQTWAISDMKLRAMWCAAGGDFHGPNVEHGYMPEAKLLSFLRRLIMKGA